MPEFWNVAVDTVVDTSKKVGGAVCDAAGKYAGADSQACRKVVDGTAEKAGEAAKDPVGTAIKTTLEGPINDFLISLWTGAVNFFQTFISSWIHAGPVISLEKDTMDWMKVATGPMVWICAVIGILIAGGKAMWNARGDDLRLMMQSLARVMIVSTGGSAFIAWMITASDSMAGWILKMAQWDKLNVKEALLKDPAAFVASAGAMSIIFSGIMVLVVLIQWILMIIRALVLPIIVLFWPISEAMNMAAGVPRFSRASRWILAFLLFKPTVAILYAFAFTLLKSQDGIGGPVMAVAVVTISIFALPFILKIVMPLSTAIGAGGGGDELIAVGKLALAAAAAGATAGAGAGAAGAGGGGAAGGAGGGGGGMAAAGGAGGGGSGGGGGMTIDSGQTLGSSGLMPVDDTPSGSTGQGSSGSPISNSNTDPEGTGTGGGSGGGPGPEELQPDPDETHPDDFILDPGNEKQDPGGGGGGDGKQHHDPNQHNSDDQESNKGGGGNNKSFERQNPPLEYQEQPQPHHREQQNRTPPPERQQQQQQAYQGMASTARPNRPKLEPWGYIP